MTVKPDQESLTAKSIKAVKWNYLGTVARVVSQLVAQLGMARLLGPQTVGYFGYALLSSGVLSLLIDQGLGSALIQAGEPDSRTTRIAFWRIMLVSALCAIGTYCAADQLAGWMGEPQAAAVLRGFSPAYLFLGLTLVAQAELRRTLRFREIQIAQTLSYVIGYVVIGLGLAAAGYGVWSLIMAWMSQALIAAALMYRYTRHAVAPINPFIRLPMSKYGRDIAAINFVNWAVDNGMNAYIGKLFGAAALGLYNTSMSLVKTPAGHLVINLQNVLFPTAAAARGNSGGMRKLYLTSIAAVAFVAFPVFGFVALQADSIVHVLLGKHWQDAGLILVPLSLAMIPHVLSSIAGSVLCGRGDQRFELGSQVLTALLYVVCFIVMWNARLEIICWAFLGIYCVRAALLAGVVVKRLDIRAAQVLAVLKGPVFGSLIMAACVIVAAGQAEKLFAPQPAGLLALASLAAFASCALLLVIAPRAVIPVPLIDLAHRINSRNAVFVTILKWIGKPERRDD